MEDHLIAIEKNIKEKNYYSVLFMVLILPSICGALESNDGQDTKQKFIDWYDKYILGLALTGQDCYRLRCSLLHQASTTDPHSSFARVIFTFPTVSGNTFHNNIMNGALNLDITLFGQKFVSGVREWIKDMSNNTNYSRNCAKVVKLYPDGLSPYISGHPVIS